MIEILGVILICCSETTDREWAAQIRDAAFRCTLVLVAVVTSIATIRSAVQAVAGDESSAGATAAPFEAALTARAHRVRRADRREAQRRLFDLVERGRSVLTDPCKVALGEAVARHTELGHRIGRVLRDDAVDLVGRGRRGAAGRSALAGSRTG